MIPSRIGRLWWLAPLLAVASSYRGFRTDFLADARFLILENRYVDSLREFWPTLARDYFWSSSGASIPYWRPITKVSWLFEAQWFGDWATGYALVQLGWQLLGVGGVMFVARRIGLHRVGAATAALLYGLHAAVAEPTCLLMARSDVVAATATIWAIGTWLAGRDGGRGWAVAHVAALVLALGSKETAVIVAPLLTVGVLLRHRNGASLIPVWSITALYLIARAGLGFPSAPLSFDALRIFASGARYLLAMLPLRVTSDVRNLPLIEAHDAVVLVRCGAAWLGFAALAVGVARRDRFAPVLLAWLLLALAPVLLVDQIHVPNVAGKYALADRWVLQSVAASALLVPLLVERLASPRIARLCAAIATLWAMAMWMLAPRLHAPYASEMALLALEDEAHEATPQRFRTEEDRCRSEDRRVIRALGRGALAEALSLTDAMPPACQGRSESLFNRFSALTRLGRFVEARPLVDRLLSLPMERRFRAPSCYLGGVVLLATGDAVRGDQLLREAERLGLADCGLEAALAAAAEARHDEGERARRMERYARCAGKP